MHNQDPFSQYLIEENQDPFSSYQIEKPQQKEEESYLSSFGRSLSRTASRSAESILGLPGDLLNLLYDVTEYGAEKIGGRPISPKVRESIKDTAPFKLLPTSESLKQKSIELTKGYTAPKTESEQTADEIAELATLLYSPGKDPKKFMGIAKHIGGNVIKAGTAVGAKELSKGLGATPGQQTAIEMGTLFLTGLFKPKLAEKYASSLYEKAYSSIPKGQTVKTSGLSKLLDKTESELLKGDKTATKKRVLDSVERLKTKIESGKIAPKELTEFYKDINESLSAKNLFDTTEGLSTTEKKYLRQRYDMLRDDIRNTLKEYGKTNPEFYDAWSKANDVSSVTHSSRRAMNYIKKHALKILPTELVLGYFSPSSVALTAGAIPLIKSGELIYQVSKSPALRKHYTDIFKFALEENAPAMNKSLKKFQKELEKN